MRVFNKRGKRIRVSDASLVFKYVVIGLAGVWLISFIPFHLSFLFSTTWQFDNFQTHFMSTYGLVSFMISLVVVACCAFVYYRYRNFCIRQMILRHILVNMILEIVCYDTRRIK